MRARKLLACICAFVLVVQIFPASALANMRADEEVGVHIVELLAAGDYVEGEAIAIVRSDAATELANTSESIAEVGADSVELASDVIQGSEGLLDDEVALRVQSSSAERYTIEHVVDHGRTTEQILCELYERSDVVAAEPNYLVEGPAAYDDETVVAQDGAAGSGGTLAANSLPLLAAGSSPTLAAQAAGVNPEDLTSLQWSLDDSLSTMTTPISPTGGYSLNVPGWLAGRTSTSAPANSSGTVCIMDTGIDTTHPDLQGVLYDFEANLPAARYAELKAEYGMGKYGLNASGSGDTEDVTGYNPHGTHVAGIVAAQWNGFGMSGVANGTKIFALRTFGNNGESQNEASLLKGFQFLVDVAQDVNLKAVNCSWGSGFTQFSYEVMVNELGKKGVNASAFDSVYECQWAHVSFDIAGNIGASNEAHDIIAAGGTIGGETEAGGLEYDDPGEVTAVYGWNDGGKTYIIAKMGLSGDPTGIRPASGTTFYIDDVAVGDANAYVAAYANMSGTSMAAPSVTGCLAVIAKDEPDTATLSDEQLSQLALERAAKLLATVDYDDDLAGLCRTGGRVNLHGQTAYAAKAPLITNAVADGDALAI